MRGRDPVVLSFGFVWALAAATRIRILPPVPFEAHFAPALYKDSELVESAAKMYRCTGKELYQRGGDPNAPPPAYLHLRDTLIYQAGAAAPDPVERSHITCVRLLYRKAAGIDGTSAASFPG